MDKQDRTDVSRAEARKVRAQMGISEEEGTNRVNPLSYFRYALEGVLQKGGPLNCENSHVVITSQYTTSGEANKVSACVP